MNVKKLLGCYLIVAALGQDYSTAMMTQWRYNTKFRTDLQNTFQITTDEPPRWLVRTVSEICQVAATFCLYSGLKLVSSQK